MEELLLIMLLTIAASFVGTVSGFGISTVMIPVLFFFFPYAETLLLAGVLHWFNDIWKISLFREGIKWRLIVAFGVPAIIASYLGATLVFNAPQMLLLRTLGGFFILYAVFLMFRKRFKIPTSSAAALVGGASSGFFAGIFGLGGAIRSAFLAAYDLKKSVYVSTIGAIALVTDTVRLVTYHTQGARLSFTLLVGLILFIPASLYGAKLAKLALDRVPQKQFRLVIAVFLFLAGLKFLLLP